MTRKIALFAIAALGFTNATAVAQDCPPAAGPKLTLGVYHMDLNDNRPICVALAGSPPTGFFKLNIHSHPAYDVGLVTVEAKNDGDCDDDGVQDVTITGNNLSTNDEVLVAVSGENLLGKTCEFWIHAEGLGTLDPKVRVVDSDVIEMKKAQEFYEALDALDLTLEEANKLRPPEE